MSKLGLKESSLSRNFGQNPYLSGEIWLTSISMTHSFKMCDWCHLSWSYMNTVLFNVITKKKNHKLTYPVAYPVVVIFIFSCLFTMLAI